MARIHQHDAELGFSVAASGVRGLLAYARARGVATEGLLEGVGLSASALEGPEARVAHAANNLLWERASEASGDAEFGLHFAERLDLDAFDVIGHLAVRSATFGEGLARVVAYSRLLHDAGRVETERHGELVAVFPGCRGLPHDVPRHIAEFSAASVVVLGRAVTGEPMVPARVDFRHPAPARIHEHLRVFGVEPRFDQPETSVWLDARALALPSRQTLPGLVTYLDAYAHDVVARLPAAETLVSQVERAIAVGLGQGVPEIEQVAARLAMSPRTLQRRLTEQGTTFLALVDGVRRAYAERYLRDDRLALTEIAFLLGFTEPSNFHRAFRRWTGTTPAAFRASRAPARTTPD